MINNKKLPTGTLLAAGLAAFAYYKYSKMSEQEKENLVGDLKDKAQKFYEQYAPQELKHLFAKKTPQAAADNPFADSSDYSG